MTTSFEGQGAGSIPVDLGNTCATCADVPVGADPDTARDGLIDQQLGVI